MPKEMTWKNAICKVLESASGALHYTEITDQIIEKGYRKNIGATPTATVGSQISMSIKNDGDSSPFVRVGKGTYLLMNKLSSNKPSKNTISPAVIEDDDEEQDNIITSFGMYWKHEAIQWCASPKLLGMQQRQAKQVDFSTQIGVYLLYDRREVIYIGRAIDQPLGKRIYDHTRDRLSTRWDRFSWFGLLPVSEEGKLSKLPESYRSDMIISLLEAVLIEAVEPRQNRKGGDWLAGMEYLQNIDTTLAKKKVLGDFEKLLK